MKNLIALILSLFLLLPALAHERTSTTDLLREDLWTKRDAYDASSILMVPMHRAYRAKDEQSIAAFRNFMRRFFEASNRDDLGLLTELQFTYLVSRFAVLEGENAACSEIGQQAYQHVVATDEAALNGPAWNWSMADFPTMFDRLDWKLSQTETTPSYLKAMIDEDLFALAIASDAAIFARMCQLPTPSNIEKAVQLASRVITKEGRSQPRGWEFQPGIWRDHSDYKYAGNTKLSLSLPVAIVPEIGVDSSHFSRFPLWLESFRCAMPQGSRERVQISQITQALEKMLLTTVLAPPTETFQGYRLTNFMSGDNGIYRYNYRTVGKGGGYEPYGLSFTFNYGWWAFLGEPMSPIFRRQRDLLPFSSEVEQTYLQPVVTEKSAPRPVHPDFERQTFLRGALLKEILDDSHACRGQWATLQRLNKRQFNFCL